MSRKKAWNVFKSLLWSGGLWFYVYGYNVKHFLLMFYTDYAGITAAAAGTLMMVGRIIDSISPPIIGAAIEKSNLRWESTDHGF